MSLDFFNQGIKADSGLQFSKQEKEFFASKLGLLDPNKTESIEIGKIVWFLTLSKISSQYRKRIMKSCKLDAGKKSFTYDQVKKVFRAIALAQKDIDPSNINISANIKTKMPVFHDQDDDDQEEQQKPPTNQPPPKLSVPAQPSPIPTSPRRQQQDFFQRPSHDAQPQPQKPKVDMFADFQPTKKSVPQHQIPSPPPQSKPQAPQVKQKEKENPLTIKLREFEVRWSKLKTVDNKIEGNQVRNLCKNLSQRSNLAKAWKLCCHTHSKALTKGQFFVFLEIVASPNIPQTMTPEMKNCINIIDHSDSHPKQRTQKNEPLSQTSVPSSTKMATSQLFQHFGRSQVSINETQKPSPRAQQKVDPKITEKLTKLSVSANDLREKQQQSNEEANQIRRNQQAMNNVMGQLEQYLLRAKQSNDNFRNTFAELKQNQQVLNQRLNKACYFINQVVKNQNILIQELANDYAQQNNFGLQRVTTLQKYVQQLTHQLQQKDAIIKKLTGKQTQHSVRNPPQNQPSPPPVQNKPVQSHSRQEHQQQQSHEQNVPEESIAREEHARRPQQEHQAVHPPEVDEQQKQRASKQVQHEQRINNLRIQVFQLLRNIKSLSPQEEPRLVEYIHQFNQEDLNRVYVQCYQEYQAKIKYEQQEMQRARMQASKQTTQQDQFSSSNFSGQPQAAQQDMFD